jgi:hypothetical protein
MNVWYADLPEMGQVAWSALTMGMYVVVYPE